MPNTTYSPEPNQSIIEKLYKQRMKNLIDMAGIHYDKGNESTAQFLILEAQELALSYDRDDEILWISISE